MKKRLKRQQVHISRRHKTAVQFVAMMLTGVIAVGASMRNTEAVSQQITANSSSVVSGNNNGWGDASAAGRSTSSKKKSSKPRKKTMTLSQAKTLAYSLSEKKDTLEDKIGTAETAYANKVKAVDIKNRYIRTFHWKFLFSMELPRDPTLDEIYESAYGPAEKLEEMRQAKNDLKDFKLSLQNDVTTYYVEVYKGRQRLEFDNERLELAKDTQAKVEAMVATGEKTDADLKAAKQSVKELESSIASTQRTINSNAKKLAKLLGLADDYGKSSPDPYLETYNLVSPYQTEVIKKLSRSDLPYLQDYTLEHDDTVFEARSAKSLAYVAITTYYQAISKQMSGGDMQIIKPYYDQIISGRQVNKRDFKSAYKSFLSAIDRYWNGSFKIGFWPIRFKFSKTLFKGKGDGQWYMQDNPNALLDASLEYMTAVKELAETESDKRQEVEDSFNTYIGLKNSLLLIQEQEADAKDEYESAKVLYRIGELTADEYNAILSDYETLQTEEMDALTSFSEQVSALNRLTCGALERLLGGEAVENENGAQLVVANQIEGASYYIVPKYESLTFELGIYIPEDFAISITDFELWCDNTQIGIRTDKGSVIRHLMTATADVDEVKIRLYNGEEFVSDCVIDAGILQGPLTIVQYAAQTEESLVVGAYEIQKNTVSDTITMKLIPDADGTDNISFFVLYDENGTAISSEEQAAVNTGVRYLPALVQSLESVTIKLYDQDGNYLYDAGFDTENQNIIKKEQ